MNDDWVWMPHAGHFIGSNYCRFHLATYIHGYLISTVGEYFPSDGVREIICQTRGIHLEGRGEEREEDFLNKVGFEKIGYDRTYETMVFKAKLLDEHSCCPYRAEDLIDVDFAGYNDPADAYLGHIKMCRKWAEAEKKQGGIK